eukprot:TRINITY_DN80080_c0_g1_i1.p1 TRINITY_DN80080_c0_g1~~TRINITY_DN80080_c0_g1_i1.p1  ORF type:complete len:242 (-),score=21.77 TRINITY_DN80080_c0_g1_i1:237-962(-)
MFPWSEKPAEFPGWFLVLWDWIDCVAFFWWFVSIKSEESYTENQAVSLAMNISIWIGLLTPFLAIVVSRDLYLAVEVCYDVFETLLIWGVQIHWHFKAPWYLTVMNQLTTTIDFVVFKGPQVFDSLMMRIPCFRAIVDYCDPSGKAVLRTRLRERAELGSLCIKVDNTRGFKQDDKITLMIKEPTEYQISHVDEGARTLMLARGISREYEVGMTVERRRLGAPGQDPYSLLGMAEEIHSVM